MRAEPAKATRLPTQRRAVGALAEQRSGEQDLQQRPRLIAIIRNLSDRITEARMNGWLGEVDGLQISLDAARAKLVALDRTKSTSSTNSTNLGIPVVRS